MTRPRPSVLLERFRPEIRAILARYRVVNPRIFGSVARGTDTAESDLDLLVSDPPQARMSLMTLGGLNAELQDLLGIPVDIIVAEDLPERVRQDIAKGARPI
ncbi:MAG: nucleotidyltransferase domain-containing protein [Rhodospirillaceae bacterium]|nr:nucleotidyltransferase domain-containing protein [Rhodospirillaceae bacterium]